MEGFSVYFQLGLEHIADFNGYDHMLFIITLCAVYFWSSWKNVLILVTAFTIGHSVTLALSALDIFRLPANLIETLIPITIFLTALYNLSIAGKPVQKGIQWNYLIALFFGFIHGLGFSNFFRGLHPDTESIVAELFAFNVGLEAGQILIVIVFMLLYALLDTLFFIRKRDWTLFWSGAGAAVSGIMILEGFLG